MTKKEIEAKAKQAGVKGTAKMKKDEIIRAVQLAEGNTDCYGRIEDCRVYTCCWREDCQ